MTSATDAGTLLEWFREMCRIRAMEETISTAYRDGQLPGLLHLSIGGEAVAVGVTSQLVDDDRIYSTHRAHGHFLAAGTDPDALMAELAGREAGLCRGRGGSMHLMDRRAVLATGVVGGTLSVAVGHSLAVGEGAVVVAFFGDGAVQAGTFHESMNLASLWSAPLLFVCENNGWAEFSSRDEHTKVGSVAEYGKVYGIPAREVDGSDVEAVVVAAGELLDHVRSGGGPALLECHINRLRPHYEGDLRRSGADEGDPLTVLHQRLAGLGVPADHLDRELESAMGAAASCLARALDEGWPDPADDARLVFSRSAPWQ